MCVYVAEAVCIYTKRVLLTHCDIILLLFPFANTNNSNKTKRIFIYFHPNIFGYKFNQTKIKLVEVEAPCVISIRAIAHPNGIVFFLLVCRIKSIAYQKKKKIGENQTYFKEKYKIDS